MLFIKQNKSNYSVGKIRHQEKTLMGCFVDSWEGGGYRRDQHECISRTLLSMKVVGNTHSDYLNSHPCSCAKTQHVFENYHITPSNGRFVDYGHSLKRSPVGKGAWVLCPQGGDTAGAGLSNKSEDDESWTHSLIPHRFNDLDGQL